MPKYSLLLPLFAVVLSAARDRPENWLQVSTPHFTVFCDGNEKQARHFADQFERMRQVFRTAFPDMPVDPAAPIVAIVVKDEKDFRALEPEAYLAKGQLNIAGLFLRAPEKNYILLRMDAGGEHPYATVYHEYTHLLLSKAGDWFPLWLNEGLAEFYQNTDVSDKDTIVGQASANDILWLRQNRLLPLPTLLAVDAKSPYYHEEQKGSIFYAESWALTHYLTVKYPRKIRDYVLLVQDHVDPVTAATRAFGDLKQLQSALEKYVEQSSFTFFRLPRLVQADDTTQKLQAITPAQAEAVQADFLAYNQREKDARTLLEQVLRDDPNNVLAHETMGYLDFRAGHLEQAQDWYQQAVKLDSQSYLANYYFASIAMSRAEPGAEIDAQIEGSLQKAIKLNPAFAPSYDQLAVFYAMRHKDLNQAYMYILQAVQLDPGNVHLRLNAANLLQAMGRYADAVAILQAAMKLAKTPDEVALVQDQLTTGQQLQSAREEDDEENRRLQQPSEGAKQADPGTPQPDSAKQEEILKGPHRTVTGTIKNVRCSFPALMNLDVDVGSQTIAMHVGNYYKIQFTASGFTPNSELQPCTDLEGAHAKVDYIESSPSKVNVLLSVELHK